MSYQFKISSLFLWYFTACSLPPMIKHGDYMCHPQPCDRYIHGTVVEYYCYPGYSLANDYKYITCQYGQWFPQMQFYCIKDGKLACISFSKRLQTFYLEQCILMNFAH